MHYQNHAQVVHTIALTVHDKLCMLFQWGATQKGGGLNSSTNYDF